MVDNGQCTPIDIMLNTYPSCNSLNGSFFIGQTNLLTFGDNTTAVAALHNPIGSDAYLYVSAISIDNISATPFLCKFWYLSMPSTTLTASTNVLSPNTTIVSNPTGEVLFGVPASAVGGVNLLNRVTPAYLTVLREDYGETILAPGQYLIATLECIDPTQMASAYVSFGWWEGRGSY